MSEPPNELSGVLFENDRKSSERHADWKGSAMVDGVEYWLSCWDKTSRAGKPYRSLSFSKKERSARNDPPPPDGDPLFGKPSKDDIPF